MDTIIEFQKKRRLFMDIQTQGTVGEALHHYKQGLGTFTQKMPELAEKFNAYTEVCFQEGNLTKKQKQLIALGISLYSQDEYCIIYHVKGCMDQGATEEEIMETIGVTTAFGGGTVMSQAVTLVQEALTELTSLTQ
jgi:AhpD family alkylhydroperoxidase